jgi:AraC-like DNA-binding protein
MDWLEAHFAEKISRDDAAAANHLSPSHFSRLFKQRFGRPFGDVLNRLRCDRAADLLARTDKSLLQIGLESGFQDQSYFTKVFRRFTGMRPREYRLKKQGES